MTFQPLDKTIPELHLIPHTLSVYTFWYPHSVVSKFTTEIYEKYPFFNVTKELDGISIVAALPTGEKGLEVDGEVKGLEEFGVAEDVYGPWNIIKIKGPLFMGLTGILHEFLIPLRRAEVNIYAISTWPTDYILVPASKLQIALDALREDGWQVEESVE